MTAVRLGSADDATAVRAVYAPYVESSTISFELAVPTESEMRARIVDRQPAHPFLVAARDGRVVGFAYAGPFSGRAAYDWSVETSVYVEEAAQGMGVGTRLYAALFAVLILQGYRQAMAGIALPNSASVAVHERLGFTLVGVYRSVGWKFGAWHDVAWWQRPLATDADLPAPPIPLDRLPPSALADALRTI